ncbi:hypothetical protein RFI_01723 [Reticulomyxa filosa]|uniref:Uncharacterized protein n=1 Tax=Reticulomyxa filosa TaxID=46433 RepID=X6P9W8_RETFI|nr:hypothetical protein RFI_01723 [Reticulomyxa filosa]|eukprot:ETO35340.1 hypothetical protein RFI_01723 [Reticulomyxa filosa]
MPLHIVVKLVFVLELIFCWSLGIVSLFWLRQIHQVRYLPVIEKRHYVVQLALNICVIGALFFEVPCSLIASALILNEGKSNMKASGYFRECDFTTKLAIIAWDISFTICCYGLLSLFPVRTWLLLRKKKKKKKKKK